MILDEETRRALEHLIADDIVHAEIVSASVTVSEDHRVVVDEIVFRFEDGRHVSVGIDTLTIERARIGACELGTVTGPALFLETYVERGVREGWRKVDVLQDYLQEVMDLI